jgi:benzoyl-CoA reductase subunit A
MYGPSVRTLLDMGGQDLKVIHCDHQGKVENFLMNDKCAAGTGRGMEIIADLLQVPIEEIGDRSFQVDREPDPVSNMCVLFAKTEVMGLLHEGMATNDVLAAYCRAMADRVVAQVKELGVHGDFAFTGGIAKNRGIVERVEKGLGVVSVKTKVDYQLAGAIGAALFGKFMYEKGRK